MGEHVLDVPQHHFDSDVIHSCQTTLALTLRDPPRVERLKKLGQLPAELETFVRRYCNIEDETIDTDDEILNWVYTEATVDLRSAIWLLSSGFYKASASSLRNALDISTACLYFQIRQNERPQQSCYGDTPLRHGILEAEILQAGMR